MYANAHTLVLDIGKSNAKLVLFTADGEVMVRRVQGNASEAAQGYTALGTRGLHNWLLQAMPTLPERRFIGRICVTTHGAAFCALGKQSLVLPPIDYEWDGYGIWRTRYAALIDAFDITGAPLLNQGLNAGLQLYWLQQNRPEAWAQIQHWVPYPQYWAWWLCGEVASEATSLGCHTHLWRPTHHTFAPWAMRQGLVQRFAPLRLAHEVLGKVRPELARSLGLSDQCRVHVGLHDSNACLARHLRAQPGASVISTGTWTVVMSPSANAQHMRLDPARDQLLNLSVLGRPVPTARFMGGREFAHLCHGADPALATVPLLLEVLSAGWTVLPVDPVQSGQAHGRVAQVCLGDTCFGNEPERVPLHWRPALAAWYCALVTAQMVQALTPAQSPLVQPLIVEGPMALNTAYVTALAAILSPRLLSRSLDEVEGTARGAWLTAHWTQPTASMRYAPVEVPDDAVIASIQAAWTQWCKRVAPTAKKERHQPHW